MWERSHGGNTKNGHKTHNPKTLPLTLLHGSDREQSVLSEGFPYIGVSPV